MKLFKLPRELLNIATYEDIPGSRDVNFGSLGLRLMDYDFPSDSFTAIHSSGFVRWREWRYRLTRWLRRTK